MGCFVTHGFSSSVFESMRCASNLSSFNVGEVAVLGKFCRTSQLVFSVFHRAPLTWQFMRRLCYRSLPLVQPEKFHLGVDSAVTKNHSSLPNDDIVTKLSYPVYPENHRDMFEELMSQC